MFFGFLLKILLVQLTFRINPYGRSSLLTLTVIASIYIIFNRVQFNYEPFLSLVIRSVLIGLIFSLLAYVLGLAKDFQKLAKKVFIKKNI
jgi:hypothetical protein